MSEPSDPSQDAHLHVTGCTLVTTWFYPSHVAVTLDWEDVPMDPDDENRPRTPTRLYPRHGNTWLIAFSVQ